MYILKIESLLELLTIIIHLVLKKPNYITLWITLVKVKFELGACYMAGSSKVSCTPVKLVVRTYDNLSTSKGLREKIERWDLLLLSTIKVWCDTFFLLKSKWFSFHRVNWKSIMQMYHWGPSLCKQNIKVGNFQTTRILKMENPLLKFTTYLYSPYVGIQMKNNVRKKKKKKKRQTHEKEV